MVRARRSGRVRRIRLSDRRVVLWLETKSVTKRAWVVVVVPAGQPRCAECGDPIQVAATGRRAVRYSLQCRRAAWRREHADLGPGAVRSVGRRPGARGPVAAWRERTGGGRG